MIKFYYHPSPNPAKVALFLEEAGLDYETVPVDTRKGEQHEAAFLAINPNAKTPAITDDGKRVFDSNAILLYLAEKTGQFMPADKAEGLSWLMFVATGIGPYSGQAVHFRHVAPNMDETGSDYGNKRYQFEARRHWKLLDDHLKDREWMVDDYSIVDMAVWGWAGPVPYIMGDDAWDMFPNVKRLTDKISARPAAKAAQALKEKFQFKQGPGRRDDEGPVPEPGGVGSVASSPLSLQGRGNRSSKPPHARQKAGESSTRTEKISSRPTSIVAARIHLAASFSVS